jgi:hypothetical protein
MPSIDLDNILDRFERMEERAATERGKQTTAFTTALDRQNAVSERGFGRLVRVLSGFGTLMLLGILALAGVQVTYGGASPAPLTVAATPTPQDAPAVADAPMPFLAPASAATPDGEAMPAPPVDENADPELEAVTGSPAGE